MLSYYVNLALRSLRRNPALTLLMILAIGVGIGASMTTLTVFRAMGADPIADRASQLFVPQMDAWGAGPSLSALTPDHLSDLLGYIDAMALMRAHEAQRQSALWEPAPRYYDLQDSFGGTPDDVFLPFTTAIDLHKQPMESTSCAAPPPPGWDGLLHSDCVWLEFWVQLPTPADAAHYRAFLTEYGAEQRRVGRFRWPPRVQLRDVRQWLVYERVVSNESRILMLVSFGFLLVCLLNAMGLMLARIMHRTVDISVRRALGAGRPAVFAQCLIESSVIGAVGALLGLAFTAVGLAALRLLLARDMQVLSHLDAADVVITIAVAILASVLAGLYPTWRASRVQPAWQLKAR